MREQWVHLKMLSEHAKWFFFGQNAFSKATMLGHNSSECSDDAYRHINCEKTTKTAAAIGSNNKKQRSETSRNMANVHKVSLAKTADRDHYYSTG